MKKFLSEWRSELLESVKRFGPAVLAYIFVRAIYGETAGIFWGIIYIISLDSSRVIIYY